MSDKTHSTAIPQVTQTTDRNSSEPTMENTNKPDAYLDAATISRSIEFVQSCNRFQWSLPNVILSGLVAIATAMSFVFAIAFGINTYSQYTTTSELKDRNSELKKSLSDANEQISSLKNNGAKLDRLYHDSLLINLSLARATSLQTQAAQQLIYANDPRMARQIVNMELLEIDNATKKAESSQEVERIFAPLRIEAGKYLMQAAWRLELMEEVEKSCAMTAKSDENCQEAYMYLGLLRLRQAIGEKQNKDQQQRLLRESIESLKLANECPGNWNIGPYLAATAFCQGNYNDAKEYANTFLRKYQGEDRRTIRHSASEEAHLVITNAIQELCNFAIQPDDRLRFRANPCANQSAEVLWPVTAKLLESIFLHALQNREEITTNEAYIESMGIYCAHIISFVRRSCINAKCRECSPEGTATVPADLRLKYNLPPFTVPAISTNKSLARRDGDSLTFFYVEIEWVDAAIQLLSDGTSDEKVLEPIAHEREIIQSESDEVKPRRYLDQAKRVRAIQPNNPRPADDDRILPAPGFRKSESVQSE